ncbi:MAG: ABC transporter permease [Bacteroidota bacterium]|nr:ABC transporter permease [Bacteroidota bacterium]
MHINTKQAWRLVLVRELRRMVSRPVYAIIVIFLPLGFLLFFGTFMSEGLPNKLPIGVIDHDCSSLSRKMIRQIDATQQVKVVQYYHHFHDANDAIQKGDIDGFLELPDHLQGRILNGTQPTIHFYYSQSDLITGSLVLKDLTTMLTTISAGANLQVREAKGQSEAASMGQILPIVPQFRNIGNPWANYSVYLISILLPGLLQLMVLLTTVYCIGIELKKNSSLKWYRVSGQSMFQALFGKLLPYTIGFTAIGCLYVVCLFRFLNYPLHNCVGWMLLANFLLVIVAQAFGIFMIGVFPVLRDGLSFAGLYGVLAFSYSGMSFPIDGMPALLQGLSYFFPLRWYFRIYQGIALNGTAPFYSLPYYILMALYLLFPFVIIKRLRNAVVNMNYPKK